MPILAQADLPTVNIGYCCIPAMMPLLAGLCYALWILAKSQAAVEVKAGKINLVELEAKLAAACRLAGAFWLGYAGLKLVALCVLGFAGLGASWWWAALDGALAAAVGVMGAWTLLQPARGVAVGVWISAFSVGAALVSLPPDAHRVFLLVALAIPGVPFLLGCKAVYLQFQKQASAQAEQSPTAESDASRLQPPGSVSSEPKEASGTIQFKCPACGKLLKANANQSGRRLRCPGAECGKLLDIPNPTSRGKE
jgi:hypothetical protein